MNPIRNFDPMQYIRGLKTRDKILYAIVAVGALYFAKKMMETYPTKKTLALTGSTLPPTGPDSIDEINGDVPYIPEGSFNSRSQTGPSKRQKRDHSRYHVPYEFDPANIF